LFRLGVTCHTDCWSRAGYHLARREKQLFERIRRRLSGPENSSVALSTQTEARRYVCEVCPPGKRNRYYDDEQMVSHLRARHPAEVKWQLAKLKDQREGFGWRWAVPDIDAESDGLCPACRGFDGSSELIHTGERAWHGGELLILVVYCRQDGEIIRRISI
jgi:hypothetical protein